jgi:hypothetical protein
MADHDYREFYEKDYLGAWNIPESGELVLTIITCTQGELNNPGTKKTTKKPVVRFKETDKKMALNVVNGKTIAALYGAKVSAWAGKNIALYKSMTRNPDGSGEVECIRIRPKIPAAGAKKLDADPPAPEIENAADYITPDQAADLETLCQDAGTTVAKLKAAANVERLALIRVADHWRALNWIDEVKKKREAR